VYEPARVHQELISTNEPLRKQIDYVIHVGDMAYAFGNFTKWNMWFERTQDISAYVPYMICAGNRDEDEIVAQRFFMPKDIPVNGVTKSPSRQNFYYSFDYLWTHVTAISIKDDFSPGSEQYKWLQQDLERAHSRVLNPNDELKWIIVVGHTPMYSSSNGHTGGNKELKTAVEPLFLQYNVDLAIWGDDHVYERSYPMYDEQADTSSLVFRTAGDVERSSGQRGSDYSLNNNNNNNNNNNGGAGLGGGTGIPVFVNPQKTIHILAGTAGIGLDGWLSEDPPSWSAYREITHGHVKLAVSRTTLKLQFIRMRNRSVADQFWISKPVEGRGGSPTNNIGVLLVIPLAVGAVIYGARRRFFFGFNPGGGGINIKRIV